MAIYVKKSDVYVTEQGWMWHSLDLSLAEARIFGYIYGLTNSKRAKTNGYKGRIRELAKLLKLDQGGISKVLRKLEDSGLITLTDGVYRSVDIVIISDDSVNKSDDSVNKSDDSVSKSDDSVNKSDDSVNKSDDSVNSPLYPLNKEINKEMERDNNIARDTIATQTPNPSSDLFEEFLSAYGASRKDGGLQQGNLNQMAQNLRECRQLWNAKTPTEQRLLLRAIKEGKWSKPRLDWTISDFQAPEPTNYNGQSLPDEPMVRAVYNGAGGLYTRAEAELYNMQILGDFKL